MILFVVAGAHNASALSSYAVQTAQPCSACDVGGFGPQLTPFGRQFKLDGYTLRGTQEFAVPLSAMAVASYVRTNADQAAPPAPHYAVNNNFTLDQSQAALGIISEPLRNSLMMASADLIITAATVGHAGSAQRANGLQFQSQKSFQQKNSTLSKSDCARVGQTSPRHASRIATFF